ncbi:SusC/RagA family TonB-linked outer membrane protein [Danxiaibacter flavus]|uniref:SusC/RagA family TonB-linked outer membrane protein n=1 Tax=Danxiaibacter flavus TaxID=3049108 RepID=A0ABV3ZM31_9BACT|nr:SusC/RagA family TonB-linked outer membrane protein [Chitinophagaceae bacterium DXS]
MTKKFTHQSFLKWLLLLSGFTFFACSLAIAQDGSAGNRKEGQSIKGKVTDGNAPLPAVTVLEKGKKNATTTDGAGAFELHVSNPQAVLVFTYVGYDTLEIPVNGQTTINAAMQAGKNNNLSGVVVTALGITRAKKSLGYDVGQIKGDDMNRVAQTNALNSMAGKVSGVAVSATGASPTASVSVVIRGIRSLNSDNQPLFVIDGVPIKNTLSNIGVNNGSNNDVDYGNAMSDLNPNDVESVSILKGPSAAALYGSRAGNGVIIITTKSGKKSKGLGVTINSTTQFDVPYHYLPTNQSYTVGTDPYTTPNGFNSWKGTIVDLAGTDTYRFGTPLNQGINAIQWNSPKDANGNYEALPMVSHNNLKNFVQTGLTATNGISIENSTDKDNYRFSFTNLTNKGIVPTTGVSRNNLALNFEHKLNSGLVLSSSINYTRSSADNVVAGNNGVLKDVAYLSPSVDVRQLKNYWLSPGVQQMKALPPVGVDENPDVLDPAKNGDNNPWFTLNQVKNSFLRNHLFGNLKASYQFNPHFSAFVRYSQDLAYENRETKISKSYNDEKNGYYGLTNIMNTESNTDFLTTYHNTFASDFDFSASAGGNLQYVYGSVNQVYSASKAGIIAPEFFNVSNIAQANLRSSSYYSQKAVYSLYATASLGFRDLAYLDLTGRNDWSSTLPENNNSYFYPSASLSLLVNKMLHMGRTVSLFKIRGGWASVGKDTDPYNLYGTAGITSFGGIVTQSTSPKLKNPTLKPEQAISTELGVDLGFFNNRLRFEGTVYRSDNKNQILSINTPASSGYSGRQINAGLVRSQGLELQLGGTVISSKDWTWDVSINYTKNDAYIMSLATGVPYFSFWQDGNSGSWTYAKGQPIPNMFDKNGNQVISNGKLGQIWDNKVATVTDKTSPYYGWPLLSTGGSLQKDGNGDFQHKEVVGNFNPKLRMGMQTAVKWKMFTLSASVDMRLGGTFFSQTYRYLQSDAAMARQTNMGIPIPASAKDNIPAFLKSNPDKYIKINGNLAMFNLVGGPTTETGGFPYTTNGNITINDGAFYPGVYSDGNGGYVENLGDPATTKFDNYEDAVTGSWSYARMSMFDASYLKLREVTLTAQLPKSFSDRLKLQGISVGVYSSNILLWTKAKAGIDPEMAFQFQTGAQGNGSQFRQGIERYNITPWTLPIGIKLNVRF